MKASTVTSPLVTAIEAAWSDIQANHPDVPDVVVTIGAGTNGKGAKRYGHFAAERWDRGETRMHELFVGGEGLKRGGTAVMGTLLHEAAHAAAEARGIQDTSRQGRWHNLHFKEIGEEFGLSLEKSSALGWSTTTVPEATELTYWDTIAELDRVIVAYRRDAVEIASTGTGTIGTGTVTAPEPKISTTASASCGCGRKIRVSRTTLEAAPIVCGLCGQEFTE